MNARPRLALRDVWRIAILAGATSAFLATRLWNLDADVALWSLSQYSPVDEFAYVVPAFHLVEYGTWVHQAAPWAPVEGLSVNAAQNVVAAATLALIGDDFWGMRASSIVFALIAFVALLAIIGQVGAAAGRVQRVSATRLGFVVLAAAAFLLIDFSVLVSARVVEPTVSRLAVAAVVVALVGRGTFLGPRHGTRRSLAFGALVGAAVLFVYIYNLFLVPAALLTLTWWAYRSEGAAGVARHGTAFILGLALSAAAYFGLILLIYGQTPLDWYRIWIESFGASTRGTGVSVDKVLSILGANVFRIGPPFLGLTLLSLPVFAWGLRHRPTPITVLLGIGLVLFVAQSAFVADYPARKFLVMVLFAVPIVASAVLLAAPFRQWVMATVARRILAIAWLAGVVALTILEPYIEPVPGDTARLASVVEVASVVGAGALLVIGLVGRAAFQRIGAVVLIVAGLAPSLYADWAFIYREPTFTYRDAQIEARAAVDGQVTGGGLSIAMRLYNTSRPVLSGYFIGQTRAEYEADVVRLFEEGIATSLFSYADAETRSGLEALGFRLVETYDIVLPRGLQMGRYRYEPATSHGDLERSDG